MDATIQPTTPSHLLDKTFRLVVLLILLSAALTFFSVARLAHFDSAPAVLPETVAPLPVVIKDYRVGLFGDDPAEAAKAAWEGHHLLEYSLAVEVAPEAVSEDAIRAARALEAAWDEYFFARALPASGFDRSAVIDRLIAHCHVRSGNASCDPLKAVFVLATDGELRSLHAAALVSEFVSARGLTAAIGAGVTDLVLRKKFNCASVSTLALHLMQRARVEVFRTLQLPDHATLAMELSQGATVYFNNAQDFLPRAFFENPMALTGYPQIGSEKTVAPGAILASTYVRSGKIHFSQKHLGLAVQDWKSALKIDPACPTTLNNLGVIFALEKNWDRASDLYRQALAVNPYYARASQNLNRVSAVLAR